MDNSVTKKEGVAYTYKGHDGALHRLQPIWGRKAGLLAAICALVLSTHKKNSYPF
ncbi:MAG: hypothetical protein KAG53_11805 [Endozoicomonadaceae bacterium]|nr:hypothetical protein [Endozoicomonadaceae bacterium]